MADVRKLPRVLHDEKAKNLFLNGGPRSIERAEKLLDDRIDTAHINQKTTLESATLAQLAEVLSRRIQDIPYSEVRALRTREHEQAADQVRTLEDLAERLRQLLEDVSDWTPTVPSCSKPLPHSPLVRRNWQSSQTHE